MTFIYNNLTYKISIRHIGYDNRYSIWIYNKLDGFYFFSLKNEEFIFYDGFQLPDDLLKFIIKIIKNKAFL